MDPAPVEQGESPVRCLSRFVHSESFWVAERIQRYIWPEIDTLYASNGHNLALLRAYTLNPKGSGLQAKP